MVAIVAGQGLGLLNTSTNLLGDKGQLGNAALARTGEQVYVNASTGNLVIQQQDEWLAGIGPDVGISRTYNSLGTGTDDNGDNWRLGLSRRISAVSGGTGVNTVGSQVTRVAEDGAETVYTWDAGRQLYVSKDGVGAFDSLQYVADSPAKWEWTDGNSRSVETYEVTANGQSRLKSVRDTDGHSIEVQYVNDTTSAFLINQIETFNNGTGSGETVTIVYETGTGRTNNIQSITTVYKKDGQVQPDVKRVSYTYELYNTSQYRLKSVSVDLTPQNQGDAESFVTTYGYLDTTSALVSNLSHTVNGTPQAVVSIGYTSGKVSSITEWSGNSASAAVTTSFVYEAGKTSINDTLQRVTELHYETTVNQSQGQLKRIVGPQVSRGEQDQVFEYDANGSVTKITDGRGLITAYEYDSNGNRIYQRDAQNNVVRRTYSATNQLLTETTYTDLDPDGEGTGAPAAGLTTRYVYDSKDHLRFVVSAAGLVTEHRYAANGLRQSMQQYNVGRYDISTLGLQQELSLNSLESWASALTDKSSMRVDYTYNSRGQLDKQTAFAKVDAATGAGVSDGTQSVSQFVYDQAGNLLQKIDGRGYEVTNLDTTWARAQRKALGIVDGAGDGKLAVNLSSADRTVIQQQAHYSTLYEFDGLNRITRVVEPVGGQTTLTTYSSTALQTQVTMANGLISTSTYDLQGRVLSVARGTSGATSALGTTNYTYNVLGQLTSVTQPTGEKTYYLYDEMGRKVGEIDGEGALTEYTYNANGQLVRTYGYANKISASMLAAVEAGKINGGAPGLPVNLLSNANTMLQWPFSRENTAATHITNSTNAGAVGSGTLEGETTLGIQQAANGIASKSTLTSPMVAITAGKRYEAQLWIGTVNATGNVYVEYLTSTNTRVGDLLPMGSQSGTGFPGGSALSNYKQLIYASAAPAGATKMRLVVDKLTSTDNTQASKLLITHPVITEVPANQALTTTLRGDLRPKPSSASDLEEFRIYDKAGRLSKTVKLMGPGVGGATAGSVVEYRYDGAGRLTDQLAYAGQVIGGNVSWLRNTRGDLSAANGTIVTSTGTITLTADAYNDRRTRYFYDADGRQVGMLDADNYLSLQGYDAAGRLLYTRKYATAMEGTLADGNTLPEIVPSTSSSPASGAFVRASTTDASAGGADQLTRYSYNSKGQLAAILDPTAYGTAYEYDAAGNVIKETRYARTAVTNSTNAVLLGAFSFDGASYINFYVNHLHTENRTTAYEYDANNRLTRKLEQPVGLETQYTYDSVGNLTKTVLAKGLVEERELQKQYDKLGRVVAELTAEGAKALVGKTTQAEIDAVWNQYGTRHTYDTTGHRIATIEPNGVDGAGNKTVYYYDKAGRLTHSVNALGEVTQSVYDSFGRVTQTKRKAAGLGASTVATWTGGLISGAPSTLKDLDWSLDAANSITSYAYDRAGLLSSSMTATNNYTGSAAASVYFYNAFGELRETYLPLWAGTRYARDRRGNAIQTDSTEFGLTWRSEQAQYDAFGRVFQRTDANGIATEYRHDKRGRVIHTSNPYNSELVGYSAYGVQTAYDAFDRVVRTTDQMGVQTTYSYDTAARTTTMRILNGYAAQVTNTFDRLGQTVKVTDKLGNYTTYDYDADGRLKATTRYAADGTKLTEEQTSYDSAGRIYETRDGKGIITKLNYDAANRVLSRIEDAATGGLQLTTAYIYDGMGRVAWTKDATGTWTHTEYDQDGRVTALVVDPTSIPTGVNNALHANPAVGGGLALRTEFAYDELGQQVKLVEGAGTSQARTTTYYFDERGHRVQETVDEGEASAGALNLTTKYHYDSNDNVVAKEDAKGQITRYTYNAANQLSYTIEADGSVIGHLYDPRGLKTITTRYAQRLDTVSLDMVLTEGQVSALVSNSDPADHVSYQLYDVMQRLQYSVDAKGFVTEYFYDEVGNVKQITAHATALGADDLTITETAEGAWWVELLFSLAGDIDNDRTERTFYDAANRPVWRIDAEGGVTQNTFDSNSRISQVRRFANAVTTVATARTSLPAGELAISGTGLAVGNLTVVLNDSKDQITHQVYDNAGRLTWTVDAEKYATKYTYDNNDRLKTSTRYNTPLAGYTVGTAPNVVNSEDYDATTNNTYDAAGRITDTQDAELVTQRTAYDSVGRVTDVTQAYGDASQQVTTHFDYDKAGRLVAETQAYGTSVASTTGYELDTLGQRVKLIDPRGTEAATGTSAWAVAERVRILGGTPTTRAAALTVGSADYNTVLAAYTTTQVFDERGRIKQTTDALGGSIFTEYDAFGNAVKVTDPNGNVGYFYFDKNNQSTLHVDPEGYAAETTFDAFGQARTITRLDTKITATLSTATRPTLSYVSANDAKTTITHDKLGRQTQLQDAEGFSEYMAYDALGNKTEYTNKLGGKFIYTHDRLGRVATEQLPLPVKQYLSDGTVKTNPVNGQTEWAVFNAFTYDSRGNLVRKVEAVGLDEQRTTNFGYNKLNKQIWKAGIETQDAYGNPFFERIEYINYDARGNIIEVTDANGNSVITTRDALGRVVRQIKRAGNWNGVSTGELVTFTYDAVGNKLIERAYANLVGFKDIYSSNSESTAPTTSYREKSFTYDANSRLVSTKLSGSQKNSYYVSRNYDTVFTNNGEIDTTNQYVSEANFTDETNQIQLVQTDGEPSRAIEIRLHNYNENFSTILQATNSEAEIIINWYSNLSEIIGVTTIQKNAAELTGGGAFIEISIDQAAPSGATSFGVTIRKTGSIDTNNSSILYVTNTLSNTKNSGVNIVSIDPASNNLSMSQRSVEFRNEYDTNGNLTKEIDANGNITSHFFDKTGNKILTVDAEGFAIRRDYNESGQLLRELKYEKSIPFSQFEQVAGNVGTLLDLIATINENSPGTRQTLMQRDRMGRVTDQTIIGLEHSVVNSESGQISIDIGDTNTHYEYNGLGQVVSEHKSTGAERIWAYDSMGREIESQSAAYTDYVGNAVRQRVHQEYNGLQLVSGKREIANSANSPDRQMRYYYDADGLLIKQRTDIDQNRVSEVSFEHDLNGNVKKAYTNRTDADGQNIVDIDAFVYDESNRVISKTTSQTVNGITKDVRSVAYEYNVFGEQTGEVNSDSEGSKLTAYDLLGRVTASNVEDDILHYYFYDANNNLVLKIMPEQWGDSYGNSYHWSSTYNLSQDFNDLKIGTATVYKYDKRNALISTITPNQTQARDTRGTPAWEIESPTDSSNQIITFGGIGDGIHSDITASGIMGSMVATGGGGLQVSATLTRHYMNLDQGFNQSTGGNVYTQVQWPNDDALGNGVYSIKVIHKSWNFPASGYNGFIGPTPEQATVLTSIDEKIYYKDANSFNGQFVSDRILHDGRPYYIETIVEVTKNSLAGPIAIGSITLQKQYVDRIETSSGGIYTNDWSSAYADGSNETLEHRFHFKGLPSATERVLVVYKPVIESNWSTVMLGADKKLADGWFALDHTSFENGSYHVQYLALDAQGKILANNYSNVSISNWQIYFDHSSASGAPAIFTDTDGYLNISPQGDLSQSAVIRYITDPAQNDWQEAIVATGSTINGASMPNWIRFRPSDYFTVGNVHAISIDFKANSNGTGPTVDKMLLTSYANGTAYEYSDYSNLRSLVNFRNLPATTSAVNLRYRSSGASPWESVTLEKGRADNYVWDTLPLLYKIDGIFTSGYYLPDAFFDFEITCLDNNQSIVLQSTGVIEFFGSTGHVYELSTTIGASSAKADWVIVGIADAAHTTVRTQKVNAFGEVIESVDTLGNITNYEYNRLGALTKKIEAEVDVVSRSGTVSRERPVTQYFYDAQGRRVGVKDANNQVSTRLLRAGDDSQEIVLKEFAPDLGHKTYAYDEFGDLRFMEDELNRRTSFEYDYAHHLKKVIKPIREDSSQAWDEFTLDERGQRILHRTTPGGGLIYEDRTDYDAAGRITRTVSAQGRETEHDYNGMTKSTTDANGRTQSEQRNIFGHVTSRTFMDGHNQQYFRDHYAGIDRNYYNYIELNLYAAEYYQNGGRAISYDFAPDGRIQSITDNISRTISAYEYDSEGRITFEGYATQDGNDFFQLANIEYDELGRIKKIKDNQYSLEYAYDAVGNRRRVTSFNADGSLQHDYWYDYDSMNRFITSMGRLSGAAGAEGTSITHEGASDAVHITYNLAGERTAALYGRDGHAELYSYTNDGYLRDVELIAAGTTIGTLASKRVTDLLGRVEAYTENGKLREYDYDKDGKVLEERSEGKVTTNELMADGTLNYSVMVDGDTTVTTTFTYDWVETARQVEVKVQAQNEAAPRWAPGISQLEYDERGFIVRAYDHIAEDDVRIIDYTVGVDGQILSRDEIGEKSQVHKRQTYFYVSGVRVGETGNDPANSSIDYAQAMVRSSEGGNAKRDWANQWDTDFDQNYQPINSGYPGFTSSGYTVQSSGETLDSIALGIWGDASMWYLIADANGLGNSSVLKVGQVLVIPNKVTNVHNNSGTYRVYNASEAMGNTMPTLPAPPVPPMMDDGCGVLGALLLIVVGTIATGLATSFLQSTWLASAGGAEVGAALTNGLGAAAGSVAQQGVGMLIGMQDGFNGKAVGSSLLSGGISNLVKDIDFSFGAIQDEMTLRALNSAGGQAIIQGLSVASGLQKRFDWRNVASAGLGVTFTQSIGNWTGDLGLQQLPAVVGQGLARSLVFQRKVDFVGMAVDTFGNALGDAVVGSIVQREQQAALERQHPVASAEEKAQILAQFAGGPGGDSDARDWGAFTADRKARISATPEWAKTHSTESGDQVVNNLASSTSPADEAAIQDLTSGKAVKNMPSPDAKSVGGGNIGKTRILGVYDVSIPDPKLRADVEKSLKMMGETKEFRDLTNKVKSERGTVNIVMGTDAAKFVNDAKYPNTIFIAPQINLEYKTVLPPDYESQFSGIKNNKDYYRAIDAFEAQYPASAPFSMERALFHELNHAAESDVSGLAYSINKIKYEAPIIERENQFMAKYFNEPYRKDHSSVVDVRPYRWPTYDKKVR